MCKFPYNLKSDKNENQYFIAVTKSE